MGPSLMSSLLFLGVHNSVIVRLFPSVLGPQGSETLDCNDYLVINLEGSLVNRRV